MYIQVSPVTKFHFKQSILTFGIKLEQKKAFPAKNGKKRTSPLNSGCSN